MIFGFEILVIAIIAIFLGIAGKVRRSQRVDRDLHGFARALGMVRVGNDLHGVRRGIPVGARLAFDSRKERAGQARWTLMARLQPPLDLGLSVTSRRAEIRDPEAGRQLVTTQNVAFNRRFVVHADELDRAIALLTPQLRLTLGKLLSHDALFLLNDGGVAVQAPHHWGTESWLREGVEVLAQIAETVQREREQVPAAGALRSHRAAWARFASAHGLHGISAPLCMWGRLEGATVYAYSVRLGPGRYCLEIWLRFEEPLALGLLIQPMRTLDRFKELFSAADHLLGDPLFDETFLVRVSDAPAAERLLDAETRQRLLAMHGRVGPLSLTDDGVSVRLPAVPPDPAVVPAVVRQLLDLAQHIAERRGRDRQAGPYR